MKSESNQLTSDILHLINYNGGYAFRCNVQGVFMGVKQGKGIFRKAPTKGISDIIACKNGLLLCIEVKIKDKQSPDQKTFQFQIERAGGLYWICRSLQEFVNLWNNIFKQNKLQI